MFIIQQQLYMCFQLCFGKGDLLTVTQVVEGGWWEGTIHNKTGWFPSNYVRETKNCEFKGLFLNLKKIKSGSLIS